MKTSNQLFCHGIMAMALLISCGLTCHAAETNAAILTVHGEVEQPLSLSLDDLRKMPRTTVKAREKGGEEVSFEGVTLADVLKRAKPRLTEKCCDNAANTCVIV